MLDISAEPSPAEHQTALTSRNVARATALIALGNILSRVLGLARESLLSNLFGASSAVDAFKIAIIVPRAIYDLLIGGHVNSAFVPVLSEYAEGKPADLWQLVSALLSLITLLMIGLILLLQIFAGQIIGTVANENTPPATLEMATHLFRLTAPALLFLSLFAILSGLLYALRRFTWPALAGAIFNLTIVLATLALHPRLGIESVAVGWLLGALIQSGLQLWGIGPEVRRLRLIFWHPAIRTISLLYAPVMLSLALDVLVNRLFSYNLASGTSEGSIAYMEWATTLMQFPHGLVATAVSAAVLPTLARQAKQGEQLGEFKQTLGLGLRLTLALIIPATLGLFVLATPIVALIFEHGAFDLQDTAITTLVLRLYLIGLPFASIDLLLIFAFYARQDTLTPAMIGLVSLVVYMVTAVFLLPYYSFFALMIADSVKHLIHAGLSFYILMRRIGWLGGQRIWETATKATLAALVMSLAATGLLILLRQHFPPYNFGNEALIVALAGGGSGALYLLLASWLGVKELQLFFQQVRRKL
jgi:putative peptidoglycan lipid II flippase